RRPTGSESRERSAHAAHHPERAQGGTRRPGAFASRNGSPPKNSLSPRRVDPHVANLERDSTDAPRVPGAIRWNAPSRRVREPERLASQNSLPPRRGDLHVANLERDSTLAARSRDPRALPRERRDLRLRLSAVVRAVEQDDGDALEDDVGRPVE